jgi:hypothetical protein
MNIDRDQAGTNYAPGKPKRNPKYPGRLTRSSISDNARQAMLCNYRRSKCLIDVGTEGFEV